MEDGRAFESSEISLNENLLAVVDDHFQLSPMNYLSCEVTGDRNQLKWNGILSDLQQFAEQELKLEGDWRYIYIYIYI
jgi:hypothetical protein